MALMVVADPIDENESLKQQVWKEPMIEELRSIEKNVMWNLVELSARKREIRVKWIFKRKLNPDCSISRHKARLVAKGFLQKQGLDFLEVFAHVARLETIRLVVAIAYAKNWSISQLDVKSAFLHGPLEEEVYSQQPLGFIVKGKEELVYKLNKALYGLKQAPIAWNRRIDSFLL